LDVLYPVGTIYTNKTNSANPATYLGFGTWVAIEGEVVVGYKSGDADFGTGGGAAGAKTVDSEHLHTMPSHYHKTAIGNDGSSGYVHGDGSGLPVYGSDVEGSVNRATFAIGGFSVTGARLARTETVDPGDTNDGGATDLDIIQPSRVCYVWERTV